MNYRFSLIDPDTGVAKRQWILSPPVTVGRCPSAEISIDDPSLSRRHCQFMVDTYDDLIVRDLGSKNGTFMDQHRIEKTAVRLGSDLRMGLIKLRVEPTDETPEQQGPRSQSPFSEMDETQRVQIISPDDEDEPPRFEIG